MSVMTHCVHHPQRDLDNQQCARCEAWFCGDCTVQIETYLLCADCKIEHLRDAYCGVRHSSLDLASISQRLSALIIDGSIFFVPYFAYIAAAGYFSGREDYVSAINIAGIFIFFYMSAGRILYEGMMLQYRSQTLGKMVAKIKVVTPQGQDLRPGQAWGRSVSRFLLNSCCLPVNYLPALFTDEKTCLHDQLASTRVVRLEK